jgi:hypothetical protein
MPGVHQRVSQLILQLVQEQDIHDLIGKEAFEEEWNSGDIDMHICDMTHAG